MKVKGQLIVSEEGSRGERKKEKGGGEGKKKKKKDETPFSPIDNIVRFVYYI